MPSNKPPPAEPSTKAGWRPKEFSRDTGLSKSAIYKIIERGGPLEVVRYGNAVIITTTPAQYLARLKTGAA